MFDREGTEGARDRTLQELRRWRARELASIAAALSVSPENAHHQARLETLSFLARAGAARGTQNPDRAALRRALAHLRDWAGWGDDQFSGLHTVAATFFGGSYLFLPSDPSTIHALQAIYRALPLVSGPIDSLRRVVETLVAAGRLSSELCHRCGFTRYERAATASSQIQIPTDSRLRELRRAVVFDREDLDLLFSDLNADAIEPLTCLPEQLDIVPLEPFMQDDQPIERQPLLRFDTCLIAYAPRLIDRACVHYVWKIASEDGWLPQFAEALHASTGTHVNWLFRLFGAESAHPSPEITFVEGAIVSQFGYQIDRDKFLLVTLATESPCNHRPIGTLWTAPGVEHFLHQNRKRERRPLVADSVGALLEINLVLPTTRAHDVQFPGRSQGLSSISMRVDELETIVLAEAVTNNALLLWKFAEHRAQVDGTELLSSEFLDIYALWQQRGRDLITMLGSGDAPHVVQIAPGVGRPLRERGARNADVHGEWDPEREAMIEMFRAEAESPLLYMSLERPWERMAVECGGKRLWISAGGPGAFNVVRTLARSFGYWAQYFRMAVTPFRIATDAPGVAVLRVHIDSTGPVRRMPNMPPDDRPTWTLEQADDVTYLRVHDNFWRNMRPDSNNDEVRLAATVLGVLDSVRITEAVLKSMQEAGTRDPRMRMLHSFDTRMHPEFTQQQFVPSLRRLQEADVLAVRHQTGSVLTQRHGHDRINGSHTSATLNEIVGELHRELSARLSELDARSAFTEFVGQVEAQVIAEKQQNLMLEALLACGMPRSELAEKYHVEWAKFSTRGTASRFLVEHIVGEIPKGRRRVSTAEFDRCVALASEIVLLGSVSDIAHFELSPVSLVFERSGYSIDARAYTDASSLVGRGITDSLLPTAKSDDIVLDVQRSDLFGELDRAAADEFGITLRDFGGAVAELINILQTEHPRILGIAEPTIRAELKQRLSWSDAQVDALKSSWALEPRARFPEPPTGVRKAELWPWKTNRSHSYIRRPIIWGFDGSVWCSAGHLWRSAKYLVDLCTTGRLKARSARMKAVMSKLVNRATAAFNDEVGLILERGGYKVRKRVDQFGHDRLVGPSGDLGDIDVLALDPARHELWLLECKDMSLGRAPHEVHNDLVALFGDGAGAHCTETKVRARLHWVETHRDAVASALAVNNASRLRIKAAIVLSRRLLSPLLARATLPVLITTDLSQRWALRDR